jgi:hypothetical protein
VDIGILSWEKRGRVLNLATHLHLLLRLRISGAIPLLPLHGIVSDNFLPFHLFKNIHYMILMNGSSVSLEVGNKF